MHQQFNTMEFSPGQHLGQSLLASRMQRLPGAYLGPATLVQMLGQRATTQAQDPAFAFLGDGETEENRWTYSQLDRKARALAVRLMDMGLTGERALLLYPPGLDFIAAFFGCLYAGVIAAPAYPPRRNRSANRVESIVEDCDPKVALTTASAGERMRDIVEETPCLAKLRWLHTDQHSDEHADKWRFPSITPDTIAFLQYTSGSTGTPKGVMLSHRNLIQNSAMIAYAFENHQVGMGVFWLPMYHDMGLIGGVVQPIYIGLPNVLMSPMAFLQKPYRWLRAISKYGSNTSGGPNFAYDLCVEKIGEREKAKLDLSRWTLAFNGAEPVRAETMDRFAEAFECCGFRRESFYPCYGLAEATLMVSGGKRFEPPVTRLFSASALEKGECVDVAANEEDSRELVGSGRTLLDEKVLIVDTQKCEPLPEGKVGEIWVRGAHVAKGYWRRPEATQETFGATLASNPHETFLRTGDLGFIHQDELFISGRLKDLIILRGVNHYPQDIEWTVDHSHEDLRMGSTAAAVVTAGGSERLAIFCEVQRHAESAEAVVDAVKRAVAREHELPVELVVLLRTGSIPKTSSGKIQRHACKHGYVNGTLEIVFEHRAWEHRGASSQQHGNEISIEPVSAGSRSPHHTAPRDESTTAIVVECIRKIAKQRAVGMTLDSSIPELGLDSLERMEIVAMIEDRFDARFPEHVLTEMITCREVIDAVETYLLKNRTVEPEGRQTYELSPDTYCIEEFPEVKRLRAIEGMFEAANLDNPYFSCHESVTRDTTIVDGKKYISFATYNYLGLSGDEALNRAAKNAVDRYGTSSSASRLVSGEKPIHRELEQAIAAFIGVQDAVVFGSGHSTNESVLGHLVGPGDLLLHDELSHNSMTQGAKLSGARRRPFPHNDWRFVDKLLDEQRSKYRRVLIAIEGIYSMDGDIGDVPGFLEVKQKHKALLYIDEAHSLGVLGLHGRGVSEHFGIRPSEVDIWMGTLSKTLGAHGGYIAGSSALVHFLKYTAPSFVFSGALAPPMAAAALAGLQVIEDEPDRVDRVMKNAKRFLAAARAQGLNTGLSHGTAIVPIIIGNSRDALELALRLRKRGINVQPILHPAVEEKAARLRFFITSAHTFEQIDYTVQCMAEEWKQMESGFAVKQQTPSASRATA